MTLGSFNSTESPVRAKTYRRKSSPRKNNRLKNDRSFKTKAFHDATTLSSLDSHYKEKTSVAIPVPRRRNSEGLASSPSETHYAGPKFSSPPPPSVLPKPPSHWLSYSDMGLQTDVAAMSQHLRSLLKVAS
ncbi:proline-rich nuclear receptor coactivator 2-like [Actinia tenebrosa]|uniref:Proline-rich nuclear receptor coactivator 2-like n=1 Tax=Actinia tenebrosa TaxID=6105 RepID=A0A6P8IW16_ACTTE|nr:proline-rich nuclear receptor coactivator 2-like [Actinia tenebrosa]